MSNKRVNPNKVPLSQADMKKAEKRWNEQLQQIKTEATSDATRFVQAVYILALHRRFNFDSDMVADLIEETERISDRLLEADYSFEDIDKELSDFGVVFLGE